jgi:hypothetical protein
VVIVHSDHNLNSTLSRYQQNGTPIKKVLIRKVEIAGKSGSVRTLQSWELRDVAVASIATTSREGEPVYSATFLFGALSVHGTVVGLEDQQFEDPDPRLVYEHQVVERVQQELPLEDDHATAVILVCRNEWNTLNSHSTGFHWFSA